MFRFHAYIIRMSMVYILTCFCVLVMCGACSGDSGEAMEYLLMKSGMDDLNSKVDKIKGLGRLRVLAVGNSYTYDGTAYIQEIMNETGVNDDDYCVYVMTDAGASLNDWNNCYMNGTVRPMSLVAGRCRMPVSMGTMEDIFAQEWDVIVFQQVSTNADDYFSYLPALKKLTDAARRHCTNKQMVFAWHLVHSYANCYEWNFSKGKERWERISLAAQCVMAYDGIDLIIPMGTAIQNARETSLNTEHDLTRDGTHLAFGVGRYVAACAWVQALFAPAFGFSVIGNTSTHNIWPSEASEEEMYKYSDSYVPVTDENRELCQQCAYFACLSPYKLRL